MDPTEISPLSSFTFVWEVDCDNDCQMMCSISKHKHIICILLLCANITGKKPSIDCQMMCSISKHKHIIRILLLCANLTGKKAFYSSKTCSKFHIIFLFFFLQVLYWMWLWFGLCIAIQYQIYLLNQGNTNYNSYLSRPHDIIHPPFWRLAGITGANGSS